MEDPVFIPCKNVLNQTGSCQLIEVLKCLNEVRNDDGKKID